MTNVVNGHVLSNVDKIEFFELKYKDEVLWGGNPFMKHKKKKSCCCGCHSFGDLRKRCKARRIAVETNNLYWGSFTSGDLQQDYEQAKNKDEFAMNHRFIMLVAKYRGRAKRDIK